MARQGQCTDEKIAGLVHSRNRYLWTKMPTTHRVMPLFISLIRYSYNNHHNQHDEEYQTGSRLPVREYCIEKTYNKASRPPPTIKGKTIASMIKIINHLKHPSIVDWLYLIFLYRLKLPFSNVQCSFRYFHNAFSNGTMSYCASIQRKSSLVWYCSYSNS